MSPVNPASIGRHTGAVDRYSCATEQSGIFLTFSRESPNLRDDARSLISSRPARRTLQYSSTV